MHGQPAILAPRQLARIVKMHWLPGARMTPPGVRAQAAVAGDILVLPVHVVLWPVRARARVSRSKFHKIRAPQWEWVGGLYMLSLPATAAATGL